MSFIKCGNYKLGDDILIFNMTSAKDCPSSKLGMCNVEKKGIKCYAMKPEIQYPAVLPARRRQEKIWNDKTPRELAQLIHKKIKNRRKTTRYIRFNEAGDFRNQEDIKKLSYIADSVKPLGVITYGYTSRVDLDFSNAKFLVKGSDNNNGNNGRTTIIEKGANAPNGFFICPKDCRKCNLCMSDSKYNIAFERH